MKSDRKTKKRKLQLEAFANVIELAHKWFLNHGDKLVEHKQEDVWDNLIRARQLLKELHNGK